VTIPAPNLDDRTWEQLVAEAREYLAHRVEGWNDFSPGDPGMVLVELFAHVTEHLLYRLNQVPDKNFLEFLKLMGLTLRPPAAAAVTLRFEAKQAAEAPIAIPRGTRVGVQRASGSGEPPVFATASDASIAPGETSAEVLAYHADMVEAELVGIGNGRPGQYVAVSRPPIVGATGDELDLVVGVEAHPDELRGRAKAREHDGRAFRLWEEVDSFAGLTADDAVFVADRRAGTIAFAPALRAPAQDGRHDGPFEPMAAVPPADREIRVWYRRGGGTEGNVTAGSISVLKDPVPGIASVTNPAPATGGRGEEELDDALLRGPQELHTVERAVTAQDYEAIARYAGGAVARARAFTRAAVWAHADPGTVELLLVPHVEPGELGDSRLDAQILHAHETATTREHIQATIDERRPLGTTCVVNWASYKTVKVRARVVVRREENLEAVEKRALDRLHKTINPLPSTGYSGWRFGQPLRASDVYDMVLKESGVRFVDGVSFEVEYAPEGDVRTVAADSFQPGTWYAGTGDTVFRSLNEARSWEAVVRFDGERVDRIRSHPEHPGLVAALSTVEGGSRLHLSADAGESWDRLDVPKLEFKVADFAWSMKGDTPSLLLATDVGLYELTLGTPVTLLQTIVVEEQTQGFDAVAVGVDAVGTRYVAVAADGAKGVWLSSRGGAAESFHIALGSAPPASGATAERGPEGEDIRVLAIQRDGPRAYLWAGAAVAGNEDGRGAWRWELRGDEDPAEHWVPFGRGWKAGSCWALAFHEQTVYAATHHGGVLRLDAQSADATWKGPGTTETGVDSGLALRDPKGFLFEEIRSVATNPAGDLVLAGTRGHGVFGSSDGRLWSTYTHRESRDMVYLPATWLFVGGEHEIKVVAEGDQ
jgi:hypothetical protein